MLTVVSQYFQEIKGVVYFTVKNSEVVGYNSEDLDNQISGLKGELKYDPQSTDSYFKRTIYVAGENKKYSTNDIEDGSFVIVEINKDNARGYVYYSNGSDFSNIPLDGSSSNSIKKLSTGSDLFDSQENEIGNGLLSADATSAKHAAFIWNMGTGNFEVAVVKYTYYPLKPKTYNNDKYFFYGSPEEGEIYTNGIWGSGAEKIFPDWRNRGNREGLHRFTLQNAWPYRPDQRQGRHRRSNRSKQERFV